MAKHWTIQEIQLLKSNYGILLPQELESLFNRSYNRIKDKASVLKIKHPSKYWSKKEIEIIKDNFDQITNEKISLILKRHPISISKKAKELGLKKSSIWNDIDKTKKCSICNIFKSYNCFSRCKNDTIRGLAHHCKECQAKSAKKCNQALRDKVFKAYGGYQCKCCLLKATNDKEKLFFCLDHINNDGKKHRDEINGRTNRIYRWLRNNDYPPIVQILCHTCNQAKQLNNGICPHQEQKCIQVTNNSDINRPIWQYTNRSHICLA